MLLCMFIFPYEKTCRTATMACLSSWMSIVLVELNASWLSSLLVPLPAHGAFDVAVDVRL
jgi:hypothetical protein